MVRVKAEPPFRPVVYMAEHKERSFNDQADIYREYLNSMANIRMMEEPVW
jgi:hypothetical protein